MRSACLIVLLSCVCFFIGKDELYSQSKDSLLILIETTKGQMRIPYLRKLTRAYLFTEPLKALEYGKEGLQLAQEAKDTLVVGKLNNMLGILYSQLGNNTEALKHFLEVVKAKEAQNDSSVTANYINLGRVYYALNQHEQFLYFTKKGIPIEQAQKDTSSLMTIYNNLAAYYEQNDSLGLAQQYADSSLYYEKLKPSIRTRTGTFSTLSKINLKQNKYALAEQFTRETIFLSRQQKDSIRLIYQLLNLSEILITQEKHPEAKPYLNEAFQITESPNVGIDDRSRVLKQMIHYNGTTSNTTPYPLISEYMMLQDSLYTRNSIEVQQEMRARYEVETSEREARSAALSLEVEKARNQAQSKVIGLLILLIGLVIIIGGLLWSRARMRQQAHLDAERISGQQQAIQAVLVAQESERERIARDLHDGIVQQLGALKLGWDHLLEQSTSSSASLASALKPLTGRLQHITQDLRTISHKMMPRVLSEAGLVPALEDLFQQSFSPNHTIWSFEPALSESRFPQAVETAIFRSTQELVHNIVKHAQASKVECQLYEVNGSLMLVIEDNGVGFSNDKTGHDGLGIRSIKSRIENLNGEISFQPATRQGTVVFIKIPLT